MQINMIIFLYLKFIQKNLQEEAEVLDTTNGNYKKTREVISDHIPVFIEVDISKDDD